MDSKPDPCARRAVIEAEIDRDHRVLLAALLRRLQRSLDRHTTAALLRQAVDDPLAACDDIERLLDECRASLRRLNDRRIDRRGRQAERPADPRVPAVAAPFARHGHYLGAFTDLGVLAEFTTGDPGPWRRWADLDDLGLELHLAGTLWTIDRDGIVFAFRCDP
jgi:hypothetical protein